jgi:hypothetical protein
MAENFKDLIQNNFKFKLYLLKHLPAAFFSGIKLKEISEEKALVTIPFKYMTKNPFRSVYFASQAMAAELATGILALANIYGRIPRVSMLVLEMKANFEKKAVTNLTFECNEGLKIKEAVEKSIETNEGVSVTVRSVGKDKTGEIVSVFHFTWTFKPKT